PSDTPSPGYPRRHPAGSKERSVDSNPPPWNAAPDSPGCRYAFSIISTFRGLTSMPLTRLLLLFLPIVVLSARTVPIRRFEANLIPLDIPEDSRSVLWIAPGPGVVRFDGLHFEPLQAPAGIDLSSARHIASGPDGSIWIGTTKGLLRFRSGAFTTELQ